MVSESQHCQDGVAAKVSYKKYYWKWSVLVANKTKFFVVAWEGGGMFMFLNIAIKVESIKIGNNMDTAKTMILDLAKFILILFVVPIIPLGELRRYF